MTVLNDILDLSKMEFNHLDLHYEQTDLRAVIGNAIGITAHQAHSKGLNVYVNIDDKLAPTVLIDNLRLRQVLLNLITNAIKFTSEGEVSLQVSVDNINEAEQFVTIVISDTGIGMDEKQTGRLFSPFTQGDSSVTRRYGGSGLGLVISERLIKLMGGAISLESTLGFGTHASIKLLVRKSPSP
ncbi:sensor histidine kinase, partial [Pseudomonas gingeri]|uniref:sensor histidine kinase n=4 Tax=Pseudomonas TaxID=286 RepID=UPI0017B8FD21